MLFLPSRTLVLLPHTHVCVCVRTHTNIRMQVHTPTPSPPSAVCTVAAPLLREGGRGRGQQRGVAALEAGLVGRVDLRSHTTETRKVCACVHACVHVYLCVCARAPLSRWPPFPQTSLKPSHCSPQTHTL